MTAQERLLVCMTVLLDDDACADFIDRFCSDDERLGYARLLTGASRSDLFRLFWLREMGGVYADLDAELTLPLREMLPPTASMLAAHGFEPEFPHGQSAVLVVPQQARGFLGCFFFISCQRCALGTSHCATQGPRAATVRL